jgi:hypothetical protein
MSIEHLALLQCKKYLNSAITAVWALPTVTPLTVGSQQIILS